MSEDDVDELVGNDAKGFAEAHLDKLRTDPVNWTIEYRDRPDGSLWIMDYPQSELHGGGPPRLRRAEGVNDNAD